MQFLGKFLGIFFRENYLYDIFLILTEIPGISLTAVKFCFHCWWSPC